MPLTRDEKKAITDKVRATMKEIAGNPAAIEAIRQKYIEILNPTPNAEGNAHAYSFKNTLMIAVQNPDATLCAGFRQWMKLGRQVRKGETGMVIWIPTLRKIDPDDDEPTERGFMLSAVFDILQTDEITQENHATAPARAASPALSFEEAFA